jgi:hypothetical protein
MQTSQEYAWRLLAAIAKGRAAMSAFGGKADIGLTPRDVRF